MTVRLVRILCSRCHWRYGYVVDSGCVSCAGEGLLAVVVPEGVDPWVAARAVTLDGVKRLEMMERGLLSTDIASAEGLPDSITVDSKKMEIGRAAGALLLKMRLRQPKVRHKVKRRTKAEIATELARKSAIEGNWREQAAKHKAERVAREKAERVAQAVLEDYRTLHPDEYAEREEIQGTMVAIEDLPAVNVRGWNAGAVVARRASR